MTATEMHTRAMLASLNISGWSATKTDTEAGAETAKLYGAKADSGKYVKRLMPKGNNAYQALQSHLSNLRVIHYAQTLPWTDDGWRMLTVKNFTPYTDMLRAGMHTADTLLAELITAYPDLKAQAIKDATEQAILTGNPRRLLTESDFPMDISREYGWKIEYSPVPCGSDFRVNLAADEIESIAARTEQRVNQAFQDAMTGPKGAVPRLYEVLAKMKDALSDPKAIFRDTLVTNVRDLCDILTRLNVTEDPKLEALRREAELLAVTDPQTLRDSSDVRIDTANQAQSILDAMTATYGTHIMS